MLPWVPEAFLTQFPVAAYVLYYMAELVRAEKKLSDWFPDFLRFPLLLQICKEP